MALYNNNFSCISCWAPAPWRLPYNNRPWVFLLLTEHRILRSRFPYIFSLQPKVIKKLFLPYIEVPQHLAYVEWFTPFCAQPDQHHLMYGVLCVLHDGSRVASIIPVSKITHSVHLFPLFSPVAPREWMTDTVLEHCQSFLVNSHSSREMFLLTRS